MKWGAKYPAFAILCVCVLAAAGALGADEYPPADHGGADLILQDGDIIWGLHTNIGRFEIPTSRTVSVHPYFPDEPGSGMVEIHADEILIIGALSAEGAGYQGGGGFGGDPGIERICVDCPDPLIEPGYQGARGFVRYGDPEPDGPWAADDKGMDGGYQWYASNGDVTTDTAIFLGSGGQGGAGGYDTPPGPQWWLPGSTGGGGGGGGGPGGGAIVLYSDSIFISGAVITRGLTGSDGYNGEDAPLSEVCPVYDLGRPCLTFSQSNGGFGGGSEKDPDKLREGKGGLNGDNSRAQSGGAGAGGGLLLYCDAPDGITIVGGMLDARGGRDQMSNGGTIKVFRRSGSIFSNQEMFASRFFFFNLDTQQPEVSTHWLYR